MRLSTLTASVKGLTLHGDDVEITGLALDSRQVERGFLFIATPGTKLDGRVFVEDAIGRGAAAIVLPVENGSGVTAPPSNSPLKGGRVPVLPASRDFSKPDRSDSSPLEGEGGGGFSTQAPPPTFLTAKDIRLATSALAAAFYPRQPEVVAAVTGTSGKTSVAQFLREIWADCGANSGSIGTLGLATSTGTEYGSLTTPDALNLHKLLDRCAGEGVTHVALEASSHGLDLRRLDHVRLAAGGFTNLSRDHLDYHADMADYLRAKLRLFGELLPRGAAAILNADIPEYAALLETAKTRGLQVISYGRKGSDIKLIDAYPDTMGQSLTVDLWGKRREIRLPLIGAFQAWNALCALGLAIGCGAGPDKAADAVTRLTGVPGRLQLAGYTASGGAVFIDYAHKPDALDNVLTAMRAHVADHPGAKLGVVFGCGGNRDKGKRPIMGAIAVRRADWVIVTDDNPRMENPATIRAEVLAGLPTGPDLLDIGDRERAIASGIERLGQGDVLIIAGKGHEPGQIVGDATLPFDDLAVARRYLGRK